MTWSPDQYLRFSDERLRPGVELLSRIPDVAAASVFDLGCGPGNLTALVDARFQDAEVVGVDASAEMIARARVDHPGMKFIHQRIETWTPDEEVDVIFSNATMHWLDHHGRLFPRLFDFVRSGGVLAIQMPNNWNAPTHSVPKTVLEGDRWTEEERRLLPTDRVDKPTEYRRWLIDNSAQFDMWETTYFQELVGTDPIWDWTSGSLLRPVLDHMEPQRREKFSEAVKAQYRLAYPPDHTGTVLLPFTRMFLVAVRK